MTDQTYTPKISSPAVLLVGEPGNGKTFSIATLVADERIEKVFYLFTDPGGDESLMDGLSYYDTDISKLHWNYVQPTVEGWDVLEDLTKKVNMMDYESIAKLKQGINKREHRQMFQLLEVLQDFKCQRTGETFGAADSWPDTYAVVFDSLTGLNKIARDATVGAKPTLHQGEWGMAMSMEENFIRKFVAGIAGPRVMVGHLDKQRDELSGAMVLQLSLLGNKLAPQIPHLFSDVIYASKEGADFTWSTAEAGIKLKSRNLPIQDKLEPNFTPLLDKWFARKKQAQESLPEVKPEGKAEN